MGPGPIKALLFVFAIICCIPETIYSDGVLPAELRNGDRIVFVGDSITERTGYTNYVESYLALRYPQAGFTFFKAGWSGEDSGKLSSRLNRDVFILNPTLVTLCYGINDLPDLPWTDEIGQTFGRNMKSLIRAFKDKRIKVIVLTPSIFGPKYRNVAEKSFNMKKLSAVAIKTANEEGVTVFDLNSFMTDIQTVGLKQDKNFNKMFEEDAVHPSPSGHLVMAYALLSALGVPQMKKESDLKLVSSGLNENVYTFKLEEQPFFIDYESRQILDLLPFMQNYNKITLKIPGNIKQLAYIRFAGETRGQFLSKNEIINGIDLGSMWDSPPMRQAEWINLITNVKEETYLNLWRTLGLNHEIWKDGLYARKFHETGITASKNMDMLRKSEVVSLKKEFEVSLRYFSVPKESINDGGFITCWSGVGPFSEKLPESDEAEFTSDPRKLSPDWFTVILDSKLVRDNLGSWFTNRSKSTAFLYTIIESPVSQLAVLSAGVDDSFKLWLNGEMTLQGSNNSVVGAKIDEFSKKVFLYKGPNYMMVRVNNKIDAFGFSLKVSGNKEPIISMPPTLQTLIKEYR